MEIFQSLIQNSFPKLDINFQDSQSIKLTLDLIFSFKAGSTESYFSFVQDFQELDQKKIKFCNDFLKDYHYDRERFYQLNERALKVKSAITTINNVISLVLNEFKHPFLRRKLSYELLLLDSDFHRLCDLTTDFLSAESLIYRYSNFFKDDFIKACELINSNSILHYSFHKILDEKASKCSESEIIDLILHSPENAINSFNLQEMDASTFHNLFYSQYFIPNQSLIQQFHYNNLTNKLIKDFCELNPDPVSRAFHYCFKSVLEYPLICKLHLLFTSKQDLTILFSKTLLSDSIVQKLIDFNYTEQELSKMNIDTLTHQLFLPELQPKQGHEAAFQVFWTLIYLLFKNSDSPALYCLNFFLNEKPDKFLTFCHKVYDSYIEPTCKRS